MIIGEKNIFAVELLKSKKSHYPMGVARIWFGDNYLGSENEEIMLSSFLASLKRIADSSETSHPCLRLGDFENDYGLIVGNGDVHDDCLAGMGEGFDDFEMYFYKRGEIIRFIWKLFENPFNEYPGYGHELHHFDVGISDYAEVVKCAREEMEG